MAQETLKEKTAKGLFWGGLSNGVQQLLNLVFGVILARKLSQADYGMIGMLTIFSAIAASMQEGGFISALNRKKEVAHKDYNAVFWMSIITSMCFYSIFYFAAPFIARFYGIPEIAPLARYSFLSFLCVSFSIAPRAYIFRNMMVRQSSIISIVAVFLSGVVGIVLAMNGFAYWGIATQNIVFTLSISVLNFYFSGWRPSLHIDLRPIREMLTFSSKLIVTNIVAAINSNVFSVLLGKLYSPRDVGNYTQANKWSFMGWSLINNMLGSIAQPVFARTDDDAERQKRIFRKLLRFTAFVCFPAMFGLALVSKEFIVILITDKWIESAGMLQLLCVAGAFMPISSLFSNLLISQGRSTAYMCISIGLCVSLVFAVLISAPFGIDVMISAYVAVNIIWVFVWFFFARKEIELRLREVIRDIGPYIVLSAGIIFVVNYVTLSMDNMYARFFTKIAFVVVSYCFALWVTGSNIFKESVEFVLKKKIEM